MKLLHIRLVSFARNSRMILSFSLSLQSFFPFYPPDYYVHISFLFHSLPVWKNIVPRLEHRSNNAITAIDTIFSFDPCIFLFLFFFSFASIFIPFLFFFQFFFPSSYTPSLELLLLENVLMAFTICVSLWEFLRGSEQDLILIETGERTVDETIGRTTFFLFFKNSIGVKRFNSGTPL